MAKLAPQFGILTVGVYFVAQIFASFPVEFLSPRLQAAHDWVFGSLAYVGLSPGIPVFSGDLPQPAPHDICVFVTGVEAGQARLLYATELCHPPTIRLVEESFDGFMTFHFGLNEARADSLSATVASLAGPLFCKSKYFGSGRLDRFDVGILKVMRDYATNELSATQAWPLSYDCRMATSLASVAPESVEQGRKFLASREWAHDDYD